MTEDTNDLEKEYKRWRDYANVLLIALTVMFTGSIIGGRSVFSIIAVIAGVIGILAIVCWHAKEYKWQDRQQKPKFLLIASSAISSQAVFLVFHLITN